MRSYFSFLSKITTAGVSLLILGTATPSYAGLIRIMADPGTPVTITLQNLDKTPPDRSGQTSPTIKPDVNGDGIVEFAFSEKTQRQNQNKVKVNKTSDGQPLEYEIQLNSSGVTLASLEPFEVPTFGTSIDDFFYTVDDALFTSNLLFQVGDTFSVNNGFIDGISEITFYENSSSLILYTGSVQIQSFDSFQPIPAIPESSTTIGILLFGALGLGLILKQKLKPS